MSAEILAPFGQSAAPQVREDVVRMLESLLDRARAGEVQLLAAGWVLPNRDIEFGLEGDASANLLVSAVAQLQHRVLSKMDAL